jgi:hypothetical protein
MFAHMPQVRDGHTHAAHLITGTAFEFAQPSAAVVFKPTIVQNLTCLAEGSFTRTSF